MLVKQELYGLSHTSSPLCCFCGYFGDGLRHIFPGGLEPPSFLSQPPKYLGLQAQATSTQRKFFLKYHAGPNSHLFPFSHGNKDMIPESTMAILGS
jgi:hypothetical protein